MAKSNDDVTTGLVTYQGPNNLGSAVISGTLDAMGQYTPAQKLKENMSSAGDMASMYDFNKDVLSAVYGKGSIASGKG